MIPPSRSCQLSQPAVTHVWKLMQRSTALCLDVNDSMLFVYALHDASNDLIGANLIALLHPSLE